MLATVQSGNVKRLALLMRRDPVFNVNKDQDGFGGALLHYAWADSSHMIPLLLVHPDIDVNWKTQSENTPFMLACYRGGTSCVRLLLKDSRVKVNERNNVGRTPLWSAADWGYLDTIKWWIASGREMDLGKPGDVAKTDAIGVAKKRDRKSVV